MPVEVVGLEVEQHGNSGPKFVRVFELEAGDLADDDLIGLDLPVEVGQRTADVAGNGSAEHDAEQLARRRLAVRPGDPENRVRKEARAELDLTPDGYPPLSRGHDETRLAWYPWALDHSLDGVEQSLLLGPEMEFDTGLPKPAHVQVLGGVDADHLDPATAQRERGRLPGASEP